MNAPAPAATVIVFRQGRSGTGPELLMLQRSSQMRFAAAACVFPGGRIDPADRALAQWIASGLEPDEAAARIAAVRETLEETGLVTGVKQPVTTARAAEARAMLLTTGELDPVLARFGWTLDLEALVPFARWCPMTPRPFDTRFYIHDLGTGLVDLTVDGTENDRLFWASAADSLAMAERGEIGVIFPTLRNLERLAKFSSFAEAAAEARRIAPAMITPWEETRNGVPHLVIPEGLGYPVTAERLDSVSRG